MKKFYFALLAPFALMGSLNAQTPATGQADPTAPAANVISLFSGAYTNVPVNTWRTDWSEGILEEVAVAGNDMKKYTNMGFVGIETVNPNQINATGMTYFNIDIWSPNFTTVGIKLVDFGADNAFQGGDDSESQVNFAGLSQSAWHTLKIPMSSFTLLSKEHISQLILVSDNNSTLFIDNIYFSNEAPPAPVVPAVAAPDPTIAAANVMSLFSGVYTNVPVDSWNTEWSQATYEEVSIAGNPTKKYSNLSFNGIETVGPNALDISEMTHFNLNVWSSDFTQLRIKLVDFGADNAFQGGDDSEQELIYEAPAQGQWITYHIPLTSFANLTGREHLSQLIISSNGSSTVYLDNVFFNSEEVVVSEPMTAAPTPTLPQAQVKSLFSGAYTNQAVENWKTDWSLGTMTDVEIEGNATKKYAAMGFVGTDIGIANQVDLTGMTHFNINVWSADFTTFTVKIVDFGANGIYDGGADDSTGEYTVDAPAQGEWVTLALPIADFAGLVGKEHISQLVFVSEGGATIFADNIYFSNGITAGREEFAKAQMLMYPNPASDLITLEAGDAIQKVAIYNVLGQQVLETSPNANAATLNVSELQSGVYMINTTVNGAQSSRKFIKK